MKIKVGVVGIGNLGTEVIKILENSPDFDLVAKFSKRNLKGTVSYERIEEYKDKIDLLFVCGGSQNELEGQSKRLIQNYNLIESYDNHPRLGNYIKHLGTLAKQSGHTALCSIGWDPGLFSLMRGLFDSLGYTPYSFWGKGLSQGHTQAIKNIKGVRDAVQFTIPNTEISERIKDGEHFEPSKSFHRRECFVVCRKWQEKRIEREIKAMPDYFEGYDVAVNFVSQVELDKIKSFAHCGEVLTENNVLNFSLNLKSNPAFTARVMTTFARALMQFVREGKHGAFSIFDVPIKYILTKNEFTYL